MGRPKIDDNEHVTAIARFMLDGDFDPRTRPSWLDKFIEGVDYYTAREHVIDRMPQTGSGRHAIRCRLYDKFGEIVGTKDEPHIA
jgi:hypothetical protein